MEEIDTNWLVLEWNLEPAHGLKGKFLEVVQLCNPKVDSIHCAG